MAVLMALRLDAALEHAQWAATDGRGGLSSEVQRGSLAEAAEDCRGCSVTVIVSGADALLSGARVPGRNRSRALAAIPFALEEGLVEDVGAYHFVCARPDAEGVYPTIVVLRAFMDRLLARLTEVGLQPASVMSEVQLLPEDDWTVLVDGESALVRLGRTRGFTTELDALALLLGTARDETDAQPGTDVALRFHGDPQLIDGVEGYAVEVQPPSSALEVLAPGLARGLNLLQADYGRATQVKRVLRNYRLSGALAAALLIVVAALGVLEYRQINAENARLQGEIEAVLKRTFPELRRVVNPRAQMGQRLSALRKEQRSTGSFLELLGAASGPIAAQPDLQLNALVYRRGRLEMELEARELRNLDTLRQEIAKVRELSASIESAKSDQQKVRGRLRVAPADAS